MHILVQVDVQGSKWGSHAILTLLHRRGIEDDKEAFPWECCCVLLEQTHSLISCLGRNKHWQLIWRGVSLDLFELHGEETAIIESERGRKVQDWQLEQLKADQSLHCRQSQGLNIKKVNSNDCLRCVRRKKFKLLHMFYLYEIFPALAADKCCSSSPYSF